MFLKNLKNLVLQADQFGSQFNFSVQGDSDTFKTLVGGVSSILINIFGLLYFTYLFVLWISNGIPPSISQVEKFMQDNASYNLKEPTLAFGIIGSEQFDKDPNIIYFIPKVLNLQKFVEVIGETQLEKGLSCKNVERIQQENYFCLTESFNISSDPLVSGQEAYISLGLIACNDDYLKPGQRCASKQEMDIFSRQGFIHMIIFLNEIDYLTQVKRTIQKSFFFPTTRYTGAKFALQVSQIEIDQRIILQSFKKFNTIANVESQTLSFSADTKSMFYKDEVLFSYYINLQPQILQVTVQYCGIPQLFAQFLGLFSFVQYLASLSCFYSQRLLKEKLVNLMIKRFYPGIKKEHQQTILNDKHPSLGPEMMLRRLKFKDLLSDLIELRFIIRMILTEKQITQIKRLGLQFSEELKFNSKDIMVEPIEISNKQQPLGRQAQNIMESNRVYPLDNQNSPNDLLILQQSKSKSEHSYKIEPGAIPNLNEDQLIVNNEIKINFIQTLLQGSLNDSKGILYQIKHKIFIISTRYKLRKHKQVKMVIVR